MPRLTFRDYLEIAKQLIGFVVMLGAVAVIVYAMDFIVNGG